jgi:hypothetical protein
MKKGFVFAVVAVVTVIAAYWAASLGALSVDTLQVTSYKEATAIMAGQNPATNLADQVRLEFLAERFIKNHQDEILKQVRQ